MRLLLIYRKTFALLNLFFIFSCVVAAQNTSYDANSIPISGSNNSAFGYQALFSNTTGSNNTANGYQALYNNTTSIRNTANGYQALFSNTTGYSNLANGYRSLYNNTTGYYNTANGPFALYNNTTGKYNTATGYVSLLNNTTGDNNTAIGLWTLFSNTAGYSNTASGSFSLQYNTTGYENTATGYQALHSNTTGYYNTSIGVNSLLNNSTGSYNTANGYQALQANTTGLDNTSSGYQALLSNTTGNYNTASGWGALVNNDVGNYNVAYGLGALGQNSNGNYNTAISNSLQTNGTGSNNTGLGYGADVSVPYLTNATAIGSGAIVDANDKVRIGDGAVTIIESSGVFTTVSDGRFKFNISESDVKGLEFINRLRPVVYNFDGKKFQDFLTKNMPENIRKKYSEKNFTTLTNIRQSGFIAQEVEKAAKEIGYDFNGVHVPDNKNDNYSLAYSQFVVPLVKAVQELSKQNDSLKKEMEELRSLIVDNNQEGSIKISNPIQGSKLFQNAPNPFKQSTIIRYSIAPTAKKAVVSISSIEGVKIEEFEVKNNNLQNIKIQAGQLSTGTYIYSLIVDGILIDSKLMILTK